MLSMDVLLAATILVLFFVVINYFYKEPSFDNKILHTCAKNVLRELDNSLASENVGLIRESVESCIPLSYISYNLDIKYYNEDNEIVKSVNFGNDLSTDFVAVNKIFNSSEGFGIANLRVWLGASDAVIQELILDLWELTVDAPLPVDFSNGLNSTGNTFGPGGNNDGWDWDYGYYGSTTSTCYYWNNATVNTDEELIIIIGDYNNCANDGEGDAQYGIKFYINNTIFSSNYINITFDWVFDDNGLDNSDDAWIKARFGNFSQMNYLGSQAGYANDDITKDVLYDFDPNDQFGTFTQNVKTYVNSEGWYYLDFGCKVRDWDNNEYLKCSFDNINVVWGG